MKMRLKFNMWPPADNEFLINLIIFIILVYVFFMIIPKFDIISLQKCYESNDPLSQELKQFLDWIIAKKLIRFQSTDIAHFPLLIKEGLLVVDGMVVAEKDWSIGNQPLMYYGLFRKFSEQLKFTYSPNIKNLFEFHLAMESPFMVNGQPPHSNLSSGMADFLVLMADRSSLHQIAIDVEAMQTNDPHFHTFFRIFFDHYKNWQLNIEDLLYWLDIYNQKVGRPNPGEYHYGWNKLKQLLKVYLSENNEAWKYAEQVALSKLGHVASDYFGASILQVLRELGGISTDTLVSWLNDPVKFHISVVLLTVEPIVDVDHLRIIKQRCLIVTFADKGYSDVIKLVSHVLTTFRDLSIEDEQLLLQFINNALCCENENIVHGTIFLMAISKSRTQQYSKLLLDLLQSESWLPSYSQPTGLFYISHQDLNGYFTFLIAYSLINGLLFNPATFEDSIIMLHTQQPALFESAVVQMMIHDEGSVRYGGNQLLFSLHGYRQIKSLTFDLLSLDALQQYKFIITIFYDRVHMKELITYVSPLLATPSDIVKELLLFKLEELQMGYKQEVIEELSPHIEALVDKTGILERLNAALKELYSNLRKKHGIRELDARYDYPALMRQFSKAQFKQYEGKKKSILPKKSFLSMVNRVTVARGGGYLHPDGTIHSFSRHSVSFTIPRTVFLSPEKQEYASYEFYSTNWSNEFSTCSQTILLSGNT
ncbi:hypothetical protein AAHN97_06320 [Chitinophaga niabensis]|uniref:hypothetical protein n=1 Tax=Chitinophaga niabensis TaxID=536979 RepID=UPI0031BA1B2C